MQNSLPPLVRRQTRFIGVRASLSIGVLLLALGAAGCAGGGNERSIPATALPNLVLQPKDLSAEFSRFDEGPLALADAPVGDRADLDRFGRVGGWKARYRRAGSPATRGPLVVESRVDLFEGAGGAEEELDTHTDELELLVRHPSSSRLLEIEDLGEEASALAPVQGDAGGSAVFFTVVWRHENAVASVVANGFAGRLVLRDVLELARAQERRIDAAAPPDA
jgi:hypothetical protein